MRTVREFLASGDKGGFAQQLLRTYDDPCDGNFWLLRAVADGANTLAINLAVGAYPEPDPDPYGEDTQYSDEETRDALAECFPVLLELDRPLTASDYTRLPREAQS